MRLLRTTVGRDALRLHLGLLLHEPLAHQCRVLLLRGGAGIVVIDRDIGVCVIVVVVGIATIAKVCSLIVGAVVV